MDEFCLVLEKAVDGASVICVPQNGAAEGPDPKSSIGIVSLDAVVPAAVKWLVEGLIPLGKLTVIGGNPGVAKSTLALTIAARLTVGRMWPHETTASPASVLVLSAEDALDDTVVPRLKVAGADLGRVKALRELSDKKGNPRPVVLPEDMATIEDAVKRHGVRLVIVDPFNAFVSGAVNSWKDAEIRTVLTPLANLAERTGVAVLVVVHLNKAAGQEALYRMGGSIAVVAAARSALLVAFDPNNEDKRLIISLKNNIAKEPKAMVFRLEDTQFGAARVVYEGQSDYKAGDILETPDVSEEERGAVQDAADFLKRQLALGPVAQTTLANYAKADGIAERTLYRAKKALCVTSRRVTLYGTAQWIWELPTEMVPEANIANDDIYDLAVLSETNSSSEEVYEWDVPEEFE